MQLWTIIIHCTSTVSLLKSITAARNQEQRIKLLQLIEKNIVSNLYVYVPTVEFMKREIIGNKQVLKLLDLLGDHDWRIS